MKKKIFQSVSALLLSLVLCTASIVSVEASSIIPASLAYFEFNVIFYDWGYGNTRYQTKRTNRNAVLQDTYLNPSQTFNTRVCKATSSGDALVVGHKWICRPGKQEFIPYDLNGLIGTKIRAEFSTRDVESNALMSGNWSPDAQN